jgi:hypothetical protein
MPTLVTIVEPNGSLGMPLAARGQAAMKDVLGEKLDTFEPKWRKWASELQGDNR